MNFLMVSNGQSIEVLLKDYKCNMIGKDYVMITYVITMSLFQIKNDSFISPFLCVIEILIEI